MYYILSIVRVCLSVRSAVNRPSDVEGFMRYINNTSFVTRFHERGLKSILPLLRYEHTKEVHQMRFNWICQSIS